MDVLQEAVIEWIQGERVPISRTELVREIMSLSSHCKLWPIATERQWHAAIDSVVKDYLIAEKDGVLSLVSVVELAKEVQLELF